MNTITCNNREFQSVGEILSEKDWLGIFPEAKMLIPLKIRELTEDRNESERTIKRKLNLIDERHQHECLLKGFWREVVKYFDVVELLKIERELWRWIMLKSISEGRKSKNKISDEDIERAKETLISYLYRGALRKTGRNFVGLCPFHNEKTPSFTIFTDNHFKCFGCGAYGSSADFIMETQKVSFIEAIKILLGYAYE